MQLRRVVLLPCYVLWNVLLRAFEIFFAPIEWISTAYLGEYPIDFSSPEKGSSPDGWFI